MKKYLAILLSICRLAGITLNDDEINLLEDQHLFCVIPSKPDIIHCYTMAYPGMIYDSFSPETYPVRQLFAWDIESQFRTLDTLDSQQLWARLRHYQKEIHTIENLEVTQETFAWQHRLFLNRVRLMDKIIALHPEGQADSLQALSKGLKCVLGAADGIDNFFLTDVAEVRAKLTAEHVHGHFLRHDLPETVTVWEEVNLDDAEWLSLTDKEFNRPGKRIPPPYHYLDYCVSGQLIYNVAYPERYPVSCLNRLDASGMLDTLVALSTHGLWARLNHYNKEIQSLEAIETATKVEERQSRYGNFTCVVTPPLASQDLNELFWCRVRLMKKMLELHPSGKTNEFRSLYFGLEQVLHLREMYAEGYDFFRSPVVQVDEFAYNLTQQDGTCSSSGNDSDASDDASEPAQSAKDILTSLAQTHIHSHFAGWLS